ncbi:hypothetical protein QAD02_015616 [Eretmocerus hayati]|uniref:Uncharacterized protein n=1 Tax=Eretmocerus hayati TaxID=131215 RepID=A0ACC2P969_9HYME|nr:hypothetical protein QAD02_015616 [Eretmocerus hayati]
MESEVRSLRQEVCRTRDSLRLANRRCGELTRELDNLGAAHERERQLRDRQLSRILRALLILESRLKHEQKSIRRLLNDKDALIAQQRHRIEELTSSTNSAKETICPRCNRDLQITNNASVVSEAEGAVCNEPISLESNDFQEHDSGLGRDIEKLKCEILTKLNEGRLDSTSQEHQDDSQQQQLDEQSQTGVKKTHSFAGSDISKASLASSENTDASIITTTTDGSPSLLSTEGFCEGESTDVSPGSTLNKSNSSRCTPSIVATDSETEGNSLLIVTDEHDIHHKCTRIARTDSKDDGMDCNYASDEDEDDEADDADIDEPVYENNLRNLGEQNNGTKPNSDDCANNNVQRITRLQESRPLRRDDDRSIHQHHQSNGGAEESSGNWYSDPDEDRLNDELLRHSVYRPSSNHNSVLECVNQILLRDMEDEENVLSVPRRFKHRGKIVRFQPARLSDIESVGSEMERRNSDEPNPASPANTAHSSCESSTGSAGEPSASIDSKRQLRDENDNDDGTPIDSFEATNSEDEFGMRIVPTIVPVLDPESGLEEDVDDTKARPLVIIEPRVKIEEPRNKSNNTRSLTTKSNNNSSGSIGKLCLAPGSPTSPRMERIEEKTCLSMSGKGLTLAKNLDYEDIELLPPLPNTGTSTSNNKLNSSSSLSAIAPALPPKPQFRSNTLVLKKIPSPSFLIDEQSRKRQPPPEQPPLNCLRSLNFDQQTKKTSTTTTTPDSPVTKKPPRSIITNRISTSPNVSNPSNVVTNIVRHFEEFRIDDESKRSPNQQQRPQQQSVVVEDLDIQQNFEEFKLDDCELDSDQLLVDDELQQVQEVQEVVHQEPDLNQQKQNANYEGFLEATGLSNKSILTPSRLLSNHKSMLKPKDVKYKSRIKASAVMQLERHATTTIHTKHWTGPFV